MVHKLYFKLALYNLTVHLIIILVVSTYIHHKNQIKVNY